MAEGREGESSWMSKMKKGGISFVTSLKEGWRHAKATLIGQVKKLTAKNEKEASEADLQAAKMQVEATDEAENQKKQLEM
ncbi:hypothetical protein COCNU_08G010700 [Cocos nucifera]|uniref:Uncharacterized protein n=1 Tax=Cocos nucifera TaxID=13894 RepID=A0A8K0N6T7_COCNU|nr:hypothetical protein COCNU_08G010700 [Cocos nucifera]